MITANGLLLSDVEIEGRRVDVLVRDGIVRAIGSDLPRAGADVIAGRGGALLPGLHDHHLHLNAMAAARRSVDVSPDAVADRDGLATALDTALTTDQATDRATDRATAGGWVRAVGYHESVAGPLDRDVLDDLLGPRGRARPVRVQHRGGALWMLNSAALDLVAARLDDSPDVERDASGRPSGRLWRYDARLLGALPDERDEQRAALRRVAGDLLRLGITGVTDATPDLDPSAAGLLAHAAPLRLHLLGAAGLTDAQLPDGATRGPRKVMLRDHDLPSYPRLLELLDTVSRGRGRGYSREPVAVHCVSRESLVLTLAALADLGAVPGDRIEHAAVVPGELEPLLRDLGLTVVTQPDLVRLRGDSYLADVDADDQPWLYRWAGLARAGIAVCGSSDAPYGEADPWRVIRSAMQRVTRTGRVIGATERVDAATALDGYLSAPQAPGRGRRRVRVGAQADLCMLTVGLDEALRAPDADLVARVFVGGTDALETGDHRPTGRLRHSS